MPGLLRSIFGMIQDPDADKRDMAAKYFLEDPRRLQQLTDSSLADNPQLLQNTLFGQNARFGGNTSASSDLANMISSAPLSDLASARKSIALDNVDPSKVDSSTIAQARGIGGQKAAEDRIYGATKTTQQQKDLVAKFNGLDTSAEANTRSIEDMARSANTVEANQRIAGNDLTQKLRGQEASRGQIGIDADKAVDDFYTANPTKKKASLMSLWNDPTLSEGFKQNLYNSNKYGDPLKQQIKDDFENQRLKISRQAHEDSVKDRADWEPKMLLSHALAAWSSAEYQGSKQGYVDLVGGVQSPAADQARQILNQGGPKIKMQATAQYNKDLSALMSAYTDPKKPITDENAQIRIDDLNAQANMLNARGIPVQKLKIGDAKDDEQTLFARWIPGVAKKQTIIAEGGGKPIAAQYNAETDPALRQKKADLYQQIRTANPKLTPAEIQKQVEAKFKEGTQ